MSLSTFSLLVFVNADAPNGILSTVQDELLITRTMDANTFAGQLVDGYGFIYQMHADGYRTLVLTDANNQFDNDLADLVLLGSTGSIVVEQNKYGAQGCTVLLGHINLAALINCQQMPHWSKRCGCFSYYNRYYNQFKGEPTNNDDFNPWHLDKPNPEPLDEC